MPLRYRIVRTLVENLGQPMDIGWIVPVVMCRDGADWIDSLRLVRMYGGQRAIPTLLSGLDFDVAWSQRNWWILNALEACPDAPAVDYAYEPNHEGTPQQWERNRQTLRRLKPLAGPIPAVTPCPKQKPVPYLATDPPIDFTPRLKPRAAGVEIQSGFFKATIGRTCCTYSYSPSDAYRPMYQVAGDVRSLLARPDLLERLKITPRQAEQLRRLPLPPGQTADAGWTELYIAHKESPAGPFRQQAAEHLGEAVRAASQSYHAAHAAFAQATEKILTAEQLGQLRAR